VTAIDASVWVSWLLPEDTNHAISRPWVTSVVARGERIILPSLAIVEVAGAVARRTGRPPLGRQAAMTLLRIPALRILPLKYDQALAASAFAADLRLRGADAVYVAFAHHHQVPLITWDKEQLSRGGEVVTVRRPTDA